MNTQRRCYQIEARRFGREGNSAKVAIALKLAEASPLVGVLQVVPADADPVVEALQSEVEVFIGLQFDYS